MTAGPPGILESTTDLTRQQRRDRAFRRIVYAFFGALAAFVARFAADYAGQYWLSVMVTIICGGCILYGAVMVWVLFLGALLPDKWVNDWFD